MKITLTGSLGHIGRPLTQKLIQKGHDVTIISSTPKRRPDIEALGARAAIGSIEDSAFLTKVFTRADVAYCMIPPDNFFKPNYRERIKSVVKNYVKVIRQAEIQRVIQLSSIGAHSATENGNLAVYFEVENILKQLPEEVGIKFIRPVGFYTNLFAFIDTIKNQSRIASNYGGEDKTVLVSTYDIADVIAEEITASFEDRKIRYVASEELTCNEIAHILGSSINKPDLQWLTISDEELFKGMTGSGMAPEVAKGFVEMNAAHHSGKIYNDYNQNRPILGDVKMTDFAEEFAAAFDNA